MARRASDAFTGRHRRVTRAENDRDCNRHAVPGKIPAPNIPRPSSIDKPPRRGTTALARTRARPFFLQSTEMPKPWEFCRTVRARCRSDARPRRATTFGRTKVASRDIATGLIIHFMEIRWENVDEGAGISVGGAWPGTAYFARNLAWPISSQ